MKFGYSGFKGSEKIRYQIKVIKGRTQRAKKGFAFY